MQYNNTVLPDHFLSFFLALQKMCYTINRKLIKTDLLYGVQMGIMDNLQNTTEDKIEDGKTLCSTTIGQEEYEGVQKYNPQLYETVQAFEDYYNNLTEEDKKNYMAQFKSSQFSIEEKKMQYALWANNICKILDMAK